MPTASAPSERSAAISWRVSYDGPDTMTYTPLRTYWLRLR